MNENVLCKCQVLETENGHCFILGSWICYTAIHPATCCPCSSNTFPPCLPLEGFHNDRLKTEDSIETEARPGRAKDLVLEGSETMSTEKLHKPRAGHTPRPRLLSVSRVYGAGLGSWEKARAFSGLWSSYLCPLSKCVTCQRRP